jgi:hypothetical protein
VTISPQRLQAARVTGGQYQITAVYRNLSKGTVPAVAPLTPTPVFNNLGVWTGQVQSNDITLVVGPPAK